METKKTYTLKIIFKDELLDVMKLGIQKDDEVFFFKRKKKPKLISGILFLEEGKHNLKIVREDIWDNSFIGFFESILEMRSGEDEMLPYYLIGEINIDLFEDTTIELFLNSEGNIINIKTDEKIGYIKTKKKSVICWTIASYFLVLIFMGFILGMMLTTLLSDRITYYILVFAIFTPCLILLFMVIRKINKHIKLFVSFIDKEK